MIAVKLELKMAYINVKEAEAILIAFQLFSQSWHGYKAVLYTDSSTAL